MKHKGLTGSALLITLSVSLMLTGCESYRAASPETTVPETAAVETTVAPTAVPTTAPVLTASPTTAETTAKKIPINTSIRTDLPAPALYTVTALTATGKTAVWADDTRETASRYLIAGDIVTVVAIVGSESRPYALLDTGEYVLLASLEVVPIATATPAPTATPKPTKVPPKETKAPSATTVAPTDPPPATTAAPTYSENCDNIRNLIIAKLQEKGLWYPDAEVIGGGSVSLTVGYASSDDQYATAFVNAKFGQAVSSGATSVSVWIADGYLNMSYEKCALPTA